jgi:hypothetical protein
MKKTFYFFGYLVSCTKIILPLNLLKSIFRYIYSGMKFYNIKDRKNMVLCKYPFDIIGARNISIGENSSFGKRCVLTAWENLDYGDDNKIRIGNNVVIGDDCHITAVNGITISDGCLLGKKITITDNSHGKINLEELSVPPVQRVDFSKGNFFLILYFKDKFLQKESIRIIYFSTVIFYLITPLSLILGHFQRLNMYFEVFMIIIIPMVYSFIQNKKLKYIYLGLNIIFSVYSLTSFFRNDTNEQKFNTYKTIFK